MRFSDRFALATAPLILRVLLCATFLWAGLGKILTETNLSPTEAAALAEMGIAVRANPPAQPDITDQLPSFAVPDPETTPEPPAEDPPATEQTDPAESSSEPATPEESPAEDTGDAPRFSLEEIALLPVAFTPAGTQPPATPHTARPINFPHGGTVKSVHRLSLLIHRAGHPGLDTESNPIRPIWPKAFSDGAWPPTLAWAAAVSEVLFALTLLVGLLTRLSALAIAGVMGTAMWLTQIGPAIQDGTARLGFLPGHDIFNAAAWQPFGWQLSLFIVALALVCTGSGPIGFDRLMFRSAPPRDAADDDIPFAQDVNPPRGPFDRSTDDS